MGVLPFIFCDPGTKLTMRYRYGVKVLGTPIATLELSEDRDLFAKALKGRDIKSGLKGASVC